MSHNMKSTIKIDTNGTDPVIRIKASHDTEDLKDKMLRIFLEKVNPECSFLRLEYFDEPGVPHNNIELTPVPNGFVAVKLNELYNLVEHSKRSADIPTETIVQNFFSAGCSRNEPYTLEQILSDIKTPGIYKF